MTVSESSGVITVSGTETDLSNFSGVNGVSDDGYNYYIQSGFRVVISGALTIDPEENSLTFDANASYPNIEYGGGTLQIGKKETVSGRDRYSEGTALRFNREATSAFDTKDQGAIKTDSDGATFIAYGGTIFTKSPLSLLGSSGGASFRRTGTVQIESLGIHTDTSISAGIQVRMDSANGDNISIIGLKLTGEVAPIMLFATNFTSFSATLRKALIQSFFSQPEDLNFENLSFGGNLGSEDFRLNSNPAEDDDVFILKNTDIGTEVRVTINQVDNRGGAVGFEQDLTVDVLDASSSKISGAKIWLQEKLDGNELEPNGRTGFNWSNANIHLITTDGVSPATTTVLTGTAKNPGTSDTTVQRSYRSKDGTNSDIFDLFFASYLHELRTVPLALKGNNGSFADIVLIDDLSITETNKATVDAYTEIDTSAKFHDRAKSDLFDSFAGETAKFVTLSGSEANLGEFNLIVDATAGSAYSRNGTTSITIKATTFTGDITTTGLVTLQNGASVNGTVTDSTGVTAPPAFLSIPNAENGVRVLVDHVEAIAFTASNINTTTNEITLTGNNFTAASFPTLVRLNFASDATLPTSTPQIVDGGLYFVKSVSSDLITISTAEGGATINFTAQGSDGASAFCTATGFTELDDSLVSGGSGYSNSFSLPNNTPVLVKAAHWAESGGVASASTFFQSTIVWNSSTGATIADAIGITASPEIIHNQIASLSSIALASQVIDANGNAIASINPVSDGSTVAGVTIALEGVGRVEINANDADGILPVVDLYMYAVYFRATEGGIRIVFGGDDASVTAIDIFNFVTNNIQFDNTNASVPLSLVGAILRDAKGGSLVAPGSNSIAFNVATTGTGAVVETGTSGLTSGESNILTSLDTRTSRVDGLIEDNGGDRFTTKALEQAPSLDGAGIRSAVGLGSANLDVQFSDVPTNVEAALINEGDGQQLIDAILQVFNSNLDVPALELQAIANQVRSELATELARIDATISSRSSHAAPDLSNLDVAVSTRSAFNADLDTVTANNMRGTDAALTALPSGLGTSANQTTIIADIAAVNAIAKKLQDFKGATIGSPLTVNTDTGVATANGQTITTTTNGSEITYTAS